MFVKKKAELPPRPKLPPTNHILQDLENTPTDDPVFAGSSAANEVTDRTSSYAMAQWFMSSIQRLKELEILLIKQKLEIEESHRELQDMAGIIRMEASK
uniref:Uncharacterized protein n=1 Tax=Panstrongylus megistus TaxID=65343 RepID=A0A069DNP4_9HEMI